MHDDDLNYQNEFKKRELQRQQDNMAYRKDFLLAELKEPDFESSARNSSNPRSYNDVLVAVAPPAGTSISLTHATTSRARTPNVLSVGNDTVAARHSCPFQQTPQTNMSPSSKFQ